MWICGLNSSKWLMIWISEHPHYYIRGCIKSSCRQSWKIHLRNVNNLMISDVGTTFECRMEGERQQVDRSSETALSTLELAFKYKWAQKISVVNVSNQKNIWCCFKVLILFSILVIFPFMLLLQLRILW